jgi:hypothetical protein
MAHVCRSVAQPAGPLARDTWMTDAPEVVTGPPAYMAQKSVTAFSAQGASTAAHDPSWTAAPGGAQPRHLLLDSSSAATVQPQTTKDSIAQKNADLLRLAADESKAHASASKVCSTCQLCFRVCLPLVLCGGCMNVTAQVWLHCLQVLHS